MSGRVGHDVYEEESTPSRDRSTRRHRKHHSSRADVDAPQEVSPPFRDRSKRHATPYAALFARPDDEVRPESPDSEPPSLQIHDMSDRHASRHAARFVRMKNRVDSERDEEEPRPLQNRHRHRTTFQETSEKHAVRYAAFFDRRFSNTGDGIEEEAPSLRSTPVKDKSYKLRRLADPEQPQFPSAPSRPSRRKRGVAIAQDPEQATCLSAPSPPIKRKRGDAVPEVPEPSASLSAQSKPSRRPSLREWLEEPSESGSDVSSRLAPEPEKDTVDVEELQKQSTFQKEDRMFMAALLFVELGAFALVMAGRAIIINAIYHPSGDLIRRFGQLVVVLGVLWYYGLQFLTCAVDPGGIHRALVSLSKGATHDVTVQMLSELRAARPQITVKSEAYSTEGAKKRLHQESTAFTYTSWLVSSKMLTGFDKFRVVHLCLEADVKFYDESTKAALQSAMAHSESICRRYSCLVDSYICTLATAPACAKDVEVRKIFPLPKYRGIEVHKVCCLQFKKSEVLASCRWKYTRACLCWAPYCYWIFHLCPLGGHLYRLIYVLCAQQYVYPWVTHISVNKQAGSNWRDINDPIPKKQGGSLTWG